MQFTRDGDHWVARCRFRDLDGTTRRLERRAAPRTAARAGLQHELRCRVGAHTHRLRPNSRFCDAAEVWTAAITERRTDATIRTYAHRLDTVVLPRLGELRLSELDTARMAEFFHDLERDTRAGEQHDGHTTTEEPATRQASDAQYVRSSAELFSEPFWTARSQRARSAGSDPRPARPGRLRTPTR